MDAELRRVLRRSRRRKATIRSLSRENARLCKGAKTSRNRIETLEADLARLRATGAVLSRALYGRKSEQQEKARSGRPRGQQHGAPGHGRTRRPGLKERSEEHNPPPDACVCGRCGQPYAPNGAEESTLVEIEVKAHKRVIRRPRWRRTCECASSPMEVSAPAVPRLFPRTLYGTSFWARFLFEHCAYFRPVHRVAAWFSSQGLTVSPGTLADSLKRFVPLFEPVAHAILAHQNKAALRHADETGWRVQELRGEERSSRAWLWTSVSGDAVCFHIDPSRSAEAAQKLFGEALLGTVIVCDRYSAYKRLVRLLGGLVILAFCWSHVRRDFIDCAAGQVDLTDWCRGWIERIAGIYRLNEARLEHYDSGLKRPAPAFDATQTALKEALDALFAEAQRELAALPDEAREGKALRSLLNHRDGLSVFVDRPQVPMDNNLAERVLRGPVIGRRLSFGSNSEDGARFTAIVYSVAGTLSMNGIDVLRWTPQLREKNLPLVVDNPRFLILPWIHIPNLGSHSVPVCRHLGPAQRLGGGVGQFEHEDLLGLAVVAPARRASGLAGKAAGQPQRAPVRRAVAGPDKARDIHERLRQKDGISMHRLDVLRQPPQAQPQHPRGQVVHPARRQDDKARVVGDQMQAPELLLRRPADPAIACGQLERAGLPADQCEPGLAVHRDMAQAFADDAVKR